MKLSMNIIILIRIAAVAALCVVAGCATTGAMSDQQKLDLYRAHAGAPVSGFRYLGRFDNWTDLGDSALAIWTRPNEAWLLELGGTCNGLSFAHAIGLTSTVGRVSARFDDVLVHNGGLPPEIPCRIQSIRPLDVKGLKAAERAARAQVSGAT